MSSEKSFQDEYISFLEGSGVAVIEDAEQASHQDEEVLPFWRGAVWPSLKTLSKLLIQMRRFFQVSIG
jgi:hypothetical protein